jgi:hypothetical protein
MTSDKERLEFAKWLFERTLGWIAAADVKVGVALTLDIAMLGGLAAAFGTSEPTTRGSWCYLWILVACVCMAVAMFCAAMAAVPRMLGPVKSKIFFTRIADFSGADYVSKFVATSEAEFLADLTLQIHRNAQIANDKHWWVRKSLLWSFAAAVPLLAAIAMLVKY